VTEYYPKGSLKSFLASTVVSHEQQISFAKNIAAGMWHLHSLNILHKDLAARNILVSVIVTTFLFLYVLIAFQVKLNQNGGLSLAITDFGLSSFTMKNLNDSHNAYPLKWMPPEFLDIRRRDFTCAGDGREVAIVIFEVYL
jgi:serine/threonine protein kinase